MSRLFGMFFPDSLFFLRAFFPGFSRDREVV
jgi:hypothetical protein